MGRDLDLDDVVAQYPEAKRELAQLKEDLAAAQMDAAKTGEREAVYLSRIQHLMSELAAARADAKRYRWLRDKKRNFIEWEDLSRTAEETMDAFVDAALAVEKK